VTDEPPRSSSPNYLLRGAHVMVHTRRLKRGVEPKHPNHSGPGADKESSYSVIGFHSGAHPSLLRSSSSSMPSRGLGSTSSALLPSVSDMPAHLASSSCPWHFGNFEYLSMPSHASRDPVRRSTENHGRSKVFSRDSYHILSDPITTRRSISP
jgi:hypothetical protein